MPLLHVSSPSINVSEETTSYPAKMHILTLSSLALALGATTINAKKTSPATDKPADKNLPYYDWEHRTTCLQDLLNPLRDTLDEPLTYEVMVVGYAWDETTMLTPDHKWNWNSTANANNKIQDYLGYAGNILSDGNEDRYNENYVFSNGEPDERGFTQFTLEVSFLLFLVSLAASWKRDSVPSHPIIAVIITILTSSPPSSPSPKPTVQSKKP